MPRTTTSCRRGRSNFTHSQEGTSFLFSILRLLRINAGSWTRVRKKGDAAFGELVNRQTAKELAMARRRIVHSRWGDAVLIVDVINDLQFPGGEKVSPWAQKLAARLKPLRAKARQFGVPIIYANDNFGRWHSSFPEIYSHCTRAGSRGAAICRRLKPHRDDYFILKPRHSAFFATSLVPLLESLKIRRLILAGIATNLCVLFTAHDAHMHQYPMVVLSDCCAAETDFDHNIALSQLERFCDTTVCLSTDFRFRDDANSKRSSRGK
jgi:nicotinamidase-related amidase